MPKMTDRERLAKIEADQDALTKEADGVRRSLRAHYGTLVAELPVEKLSEREFRDVLVQAVRVGGGAAVSALRTLAAAGDAPAERGAGGDGLPPQRRKPAAAAPVPEPQEAV